MKHKRLALLLGVFGVFLICGVESNTECTVWGKTISDIRNGKISNPASITTARTTCTWTFKVLASQVLELNVTRMNLIPAHQCQFAYIQIEAGSTKVRFCGKTRPPVMYFKGQQDVEVTYKFDKGSKLREFAIEYKQKSTVPDDQCQKDTSRCRNGNCVSQEAICNGIDDCGDGTDESTCGHKVTTPSDCGHPAVVPEQGNDDRIVGGREAVPGSWPWQVSFQRTNIFPSGHFCGGSLINNLWIVSAAHCFVIIKAEDVRVKLGDHLSFEHEEGEVVRYLDKILMHPNYQDELKDKRHDIALVKLKAPVKYSKTISPVCLPKHSQVVPTGSMLHVTGWGRTQGALSPQIETTTVYLKQAMVPAVDWKQCYSENLEKLAMETICTSYGEDGIGPCIGDSGGPLVGINNSTNRWTLFGIVSWGKTTCEFSTTSAVFTKVSAYIPWIQTTIFND